MGRKRKTKSWKHTLFIFLLTFFTATVVSGASIVLLNHTKPWVAALVLLIVVFLHVVFDTVGTASTAATEPPHHARAAKKIYGAKQSIMLVKNADVVSTFTNDIVGDVTSTLGGAMAATIVLSLIREYPRMSAYEVSVNTLMLALVASLTVAGKALGKTLAIQRADHIIGIVGRIMAMFEDVIPWRTKDHKKQGGKKNGSARKDS
ncbi:MAG: hypothetical protein LBT22_04505 [Peptococcaceae bacterium]|nr:hypothetical protein [Peptococcaceae bacterium]